MQQQVKHEGVTDQGQQGLVREEMGGMAEEMIQTDDDTRGMSEKPVRNLKPSSGPARVRGPVSPQPFDPCVDRPHLPAGEQQELVDGVVAPGLGVKEAKDKLTPGTSLRMQRWGFFIMLGCRERDCCLLAIASHLPVSIAKDILLIGSDETVDSPENDLRSQGRPRTAW